jgi:Ras-related protein Rab-8A
MEEKINIILLGNTEVGKTSFILRYTEEYYQPIYLTTIGFDFKVKEATLSNNKKYKLYFYDTTGQEKYRSIAVNLIKNAEGVLLMYDVTKQSSFQSISEWMESIYNSKPKNFPIILAGNKIDLEKREVTTEEGEKLAKDYGIPFFEISNKEGINVTEACLALANKIVEQREAEANANNSDNAKDDAKVEKGKKLDEVQANDKKKKKCC